jgi:hypothetical protein
MPTPNKPGQIPGPESGVIPAEAGIQYTIIYTDKSHM